MSPTDPIRSKIATTTFILVAMGTLQAASAHPISVTRGTATIEENALTVSVDLNSHGADHPTNPLTNTAAAKAADLDRTLIKKKGEAILKHLSVRDHEGKRLPGQPVQHAFTEPAITESPDNQNRISPLCSRRYTLTPNTPFVSLQLTPPMTASNSPTNLVLAVHGKIVGSKFIHLTAAGNVEILPISRSTAESEGASRENGVCGAKTLAWLGIRDDEEPVRALVKIADRSVSVDVVIPTQVLETWIPITRANRDFIEPDEQMSAITTLKEFMTDRIQVEINNLTSTASSVSAEFVDVDDNLTTKQWPKRRLSSWTSRLHVALEHSNHDQVDQVSVSWTLFNAKVLTASALISTPDACHEVDLSTYTPRWSWLRR